MIKLSKKHMSELKKSYSYTVEGVEDVLALFEETDKVSVKLLRKFARNRRHFRIMLNGLSWLLFRQYLRLDRFENDYVYSVLSRNSSNSVAHPFELKFAGKNSSWSLEFPQSVGIGKPEGLPSSKKKNNGGRKNEK